MLGERGWIGFIGYFGFLTAPVLLLLRRSRREPLPPTVAGFSVILAAILSYQIPNNTIGPLTLILVGALAGYAQRLPRTTTTGEDPPPADPRYAPQPGYTRFPDAAPPVRHRGVRDVRIS